MLHCFEDSIGVVCTSAFLTIRCGVASCQRRVDWSRVKDRLNHLWVRVVFAPYLPLSFRVQIPGDQPVCRGFDYRGRGTHGAAVARSSCCVWRADCEIGYQACGSWKYQPRFAGLVRCEGTNTTDRELELPTGTGIVIVLEGTYLVTIYECKDPCGSCLARPLGVIKHCLLFHNC